MRALLILSVCAVLLFGCTGGTAKPGTTPGGTPPGTPPSTGGGDCETKYSFSELDAGVLAQNTKLVATVTCAANKTLDLTLDGQSAATYLVEGDAATPVELEFAPKKDGTLKLEVELDGETIFSRDWTVRPLGSDDTKGLENDAASFREWRAMAVDLDEPIRAGKVRMFLKRISDRTQPGTMISVDLRDDDGGNPGAIIATSEKPITATTLSDNWISFEFQDKPLLSAGRKWIVLRIIQTEDVTLVSDNVNLHYVAVDKQAEGNDYTRQMVLNVNTVSGEATETEWTPLSYDRVYTMTLSAG